MQAMHATIQMAVSVAVHVAVQSVRLRKWQCVAVYIASPRMMEVYVVVHVALYVAMYVAVHMAMHVDISIYCIPGNMAVLMAVYMAEYLAGTVMLAVYGWY